MPDFDLDDALQPGPQSWTWTVVLTAHVQRSPMEHGERLNRIHAFDAQAGPWATYPASGEPHIIGVKSFTDFWDEPDQTMCIYCEVDLTAEDVPFTWTEEEAATEANRYFEVTARRTLGPGMNREIERSGMNVRSAKEKHA